jgi:hypothetical protein
MEQMHTRLIPTLFVAALAAAQPLKQTCPAPSFPGAATPIDTICGASGSAGPTTPDGLENSFKNNFCARGTLGTVTAASLTTLQATTEDAQRKAHLKPGPPPPKDRSFLTALGEGDHVSFEGFVFLARQECTETVNCEFIPPNTDASHDIHISLLDHQRTLTPVPKNPPPAQDAEECTSIVAEMIPHHRPPEWTACNVNEVANNGLRVRITGQRFFDAAHVPCNGKLPVGSNPKRSSLWEIHPIYTFEVCPKGDCKTGGWVALTTFAKGKTQCQRPEPCSGPKPAKNP